MSERETELQVVVVNTPESALFGQPVEVVNQDREKAERLERESGYRWGRWRSTSGWTKLHLLDGMVMGCGGVAVYNADRTHTLDGDYCKRCLAADVRRLVQERERRRQYGLRSVIQPDIHMSINADSTGFDHAAAAAARVIQDMLARNIREQEERAFLYGVNHEQRRPVIEPPRRPTLVKRVASGVRLWCESLGTTFLPLVRFATGLFTGTVRLSRIFNAVGEAVASEMETALQQEIDQMARDARAALDAMPHSRLFEMSPDQYRRATENPWDLSAVLSEDELRMQRARIYDPQPMFYTGRAPDAWCTASRRDNLTGYTGRRPALIPNAQGPTAEEIQQTIARLRLHSD